MAVKSGITVWGDGVRYEAGEKVILDNVSFVALPGEFTAVMGPSGSGKTTLLNSILNRLKGCKGRISFNDTPVTTKSALRHAHYVMAHDIAHSYLTVRETLDFTARLRLADRTRAEQKAKVDEVMEWLALEDCADTYIGGDWRKGISKGQLKRVAIAAELLGDPSILVLDEPTSGLDSHLALDLCIRLARIAHETGTTVIASIHQPSQRAFECFDRVLLISNGGLLYSGLRYQAADYFADICRQLPEGYSVPDYLLELATIQEDCGDHPPQPKNKRGAPDDEIALLKQQNKASSDSSRTGSVPFYSTTDRIALMYRAFDTSVHHTAIMEAITEAEKTPLPPVPENKRKDGGDWRGQFSIVWKRSTLNSVRNPLSTVIIVLVNVIQAFVLGALFFQLQRDVTDNQEEHIPVSKWALWDNVIIDFLAYGLDKEGLDPFLAVIESGVDGKDRSTLFDLMTNQDVIDWFPQVTECVRNRFETIHFAPNGIVYPPWNWEVGSINGNNTEETILHRLLQAVSDTEPVDLSTTFQTALSTLVTLGEATTGDARGRLKTTTTDIELSSTGTSTAMTTPTTTTTTVSTSSISLSDLSGGSDMPTTGAAVVTDGLLTAASSNTADILTATPTATTPREKATATTLTDGLPPADAEESIIVSMPMEKVVSMIVQSMQLLDYMITGKFEPPVFAHHYSLSTRSLLAFWQDTIKKVAPYVTQVTCCASLGYQFSTTASRECDPTYPWPDPPKRKLGTWPEVVNQLGTVSYQLQDAVSNMMDRVIERKLEAQKNGLDGVDRAAFANKVIRTSDTIKKATKRGLSVPPTDILQGTFKAPRVSTRKSSSGSSLGGMASDLWALIFKNPDTPLYKMIENLGEWLGRMRNDCDNSYCSSVVDFVDFMAGQMSNMAATILTVLNFAGGLFFGAGNLGFATYDILLQFPKERAIFNREFANKLYRPSAYFIAKMLSDLPFQVLPAIVWSIIYYFMLGLDTSVAWKIYAYLGVAVCVSFGAYSLGYLVSAASPRMEVALIASPMVLVIMLCQAGFMLRDGDYQAWIAWFRFFSIYRYGFFGLNCIQFPPGGTFGSLDNDMILPLLGVMETRLWANVACLLGLSFGFRICAFFAMKYMHRRIGIEA